MEFHKFLITFLISNLQYKIALMCGILCFLSSRKYPDEELFQLSTLLEHRGPDNKHINSLKVNNSSTINFITTQLMIVGTDPFPLTFPYSKSGSSKFSMFIIGNIEIYNYKDLYQKFFQNEFSWDVTFSDARIILPLLNKFYLTFKSSAKAFEETLKCLKGDYAIIIYDGDGNLLIARDPIGIRPLYYHQSDNGEFMFCSEIEPLLMLSEDEITAETVKPGTFTVINLNEKIFPIQWSLQEQAIDQLCLTRTLDQNNTNHIIENIFKRLEKSVYDRIPSTNFAIFLSGGIDSSILLAFILLNKPKSKFFVISVGFADSQDLIYSRKLCTVLNIDLQEVILEKNEIVKALPNIIKILKQRFSTVNSIDVSIALPLYFASKKAQELQCKVALTGQGADELFIGYNKYFESDMVKDNQELLEKINHDLSNIAVQNLERDDLISMQFNIEIRFPYLDIDLIMYVLNLNLDIFFGYDEENRKILLRKVAQDLNLPDFIVQRPKKAAQYGTSVMKNLYQLAKTKSSLKEYLESFQ